MKSFSPVSKPIHTPEHIQRFSWLDLFRCILVLFVFAFHANMHLGCNFGFLTPFISQGAVFMSAFFMLSGFILYYKYDGLSFSRTGLKTFYLRRTAEIWPVYVVVYGLYLVFFNTLPITDNLLLAPTELLLQQTFFAGSFSVLHNGGTWFLSCLVFCYFLFPLCLCFIKDCTKARRLIGIVLLLYALAGTAPFLADTMSFGDVYSNPFFRFFEFLIGMLLAKLYKLRRRPAAPSFLYILPLLAAWGLLIGGITFFQQRSFGNYVLYGFFVIPLFAVMIDSSAKLPPPPRTSRLFAFFSKFSLCFFLAQFFTWKPSRLLRDAYPDMLGSGGRTFLLAFLICSIIAGVLYYAVERPMKKVLYRLFNMK